MSLFLFTIALIASFFLSPKVAFASWGALLVVIGIVKLWARLAFGYYTPYGGALRSVAWAALFFAMASFTLVSFTKGTGITPKPWIVKASYFAAYTCGFKLGLRGNWGLSALIAASSTVLSSIFLAVFGTWFI